MHLLVGHSRDRLDASEAGADGHPRLPEPRAVRAADPAAPWPIGALPECEAPEDENDGEQPDQHRMRAPVQWSSRAKVRSQRQECFDPFVSTKPAR